jgi:hypothetical protein
MMELPPIAADLASIVITGPMRPVVISPSWLREIDLIGDSELEQANFELLIPAEATIFQAGWLRVLANPQSLEVQTTQEVEFERLRDVMLGILRARDDAAIAMMGINRTVHVKLNDRGLWHAVGDHLVNNELWEGILHLPGMRSVTYWGARADGYGGRIHVQVEPSYQFQPGIFVAYNDHYDLSKVEKILTLRTDEGFNRAEDTEVSAEKVAVAKEILTDNWMESMNLFNAVLERTFSQTGQSDG